MREINKDYLYYFSRYSRANAAHFLRLAPSVCIPAAYN